MITKLFSQRGAAIAAIALATAVLLPACSPKPPVELGAQTQKVSSSDEVISREASSAAAPSEGQAAVAVSETLHLVHKRTFSADQTYTIKASGNAEYVELLKAWMFKDGDGKFFRFNTGSTIGTETSKPTVDVGARSAAISGSDRGFVASVTATAGGAEVSTKTLNVTTRFTHEDTYNDVSYTLASTASAEFVSEQNAHFAWIENTLYRANLSGSVDALSGKPSANIGARATQISGNDDLLSSDPTVTAGALSFSGNTRALNVSFTYVHEQKYQKLIYTITHSETATLVPDQKAHMAWINGNLYKVAFGSDNVIELSARPVLNLGQRVFKLDNSDSLVTVEVIPTALTDDNKAIVVTVRHYFRHTESFQIEEYYGESTEVARYNENYKVWTVIIDGRIYAVAFDGDNVNDGSVIVVKAPSGFHRPEVLVIKTPGNDDPPVVVPGKGPKHPAPADDNDPPVVIPSRR